MIKGANPQPPLFTILLALWGHIQPRRRFQLALVAVLMLLSAFAELISLGSVLPFLAALSSPETLYNRPWMQPLIGAFELSSPNQLLLPLFGVFGLAALLSGITRLTLLWAQTHLSCSIGADLGCEAYRRTLYQAYSVHISRNSAEVISNIMNKVGGLVFSTLLPILNLVSALLILVSVMALLLAVDPLVTTGAFAGFGAIYLGITVIARKDLLRAGRQVTLEQDHLMKVMQEGLGGIRDVIIDGTQEIYIRIFRDSDVLLRHASAKIAFIGGAPRYVVETIGMVLIGFIAYLLSEGSGGLIEAIPLLGALALGAQRLLPLQQQIYNSVTILIAGKAVLIDALLLLDQPISSKKIIDTSSSLTFREVLAFEKVNFRHSSQSAWVLKGVDFEIRRGQRIGIIGVTGSGKSTIVDILMGLLTPTEGHLKVDGVIIDRFKQSAWQKHLVHVPQHIYLADTTIAENIAFGVPAEKIDMKRVESAAVNAQIDSAIRDWPDGYQTRVGERGVRLSGGQRQRIGIARAFYKNADIVILDEATSALDMETEDAVMSAIDSLHNDLTIIIVAHRLSTLKSCDQIVEINDGAVSWTGTFQELALSKIDS